MGAERPKQIPYRWTAQDAAGTKRKPAKIANPYGINPDEVFASTGSPPPNDKRWASQFTDGERVLLPADKCRLPYMLEQFFVQGHVWEEVPQQLVAGATTIGALCQKLADTGQERYAIYADFSSKAPPPKTPEAKRTAANRKNELAKKLFWYWKNTDYRWALLHSGVSLTTIDEAPETLATTAKATPPSAKDPVAGSLTWVLAKETAQPPAGAKPHAKAQTQKPPRAFPDPTTIRLPAKPEWNADPDPGTPFADLPVEFRETIKRSFVDRRCGVRNAHLNLDNAFWGSPDLRSAWEALRRFSAQGVNILVRLYRRMEAIDPTLKLWKQIMYIRNEWWGGSGGVKVVYYSPPAMRSTLDNLFSATARPSVARDRFFYGLEHQRASSIQLAPEAVDDNAELPDCDTWREVDKPREEACHFCVGKSDLPGFSVTPAVRRNEFFEADLIEPREVGLDDIHLDWFSPVDGVDTTLKKCNYLSVWSGSGKHWFQASMGIGKPVFYFQYVDETIDARRASVTGTQKAARFDDLAKRWEAEKWKLAVQGKAGNDKARDYSVELDGLFAEGAGPEEPRQSRID